VDDFDDFIDWLCNELDARAESAKAADEFVGALNRRLQRLVVGYRLVTEADWGGHYRDGWRDGEANLRVWQAAGAP
jgi:hypothetical protein